MSRGCREHWQSPGSQLSAPRIRWGAQRGRGLRPSPFLPSLEKFAGSCRMVCERTACRISAWSRCLPVLLGDDFYFTPASLKPSNKIRTARLVTAPPGHGPFLNLSRRQHPAHDGRVQLVFALRYVARIVFHSQDKDGQGSLFIEVFLCRNDGKNSVQPMLAVRRLVAMLVYVPGKDADLIEIVRQAVVRIGQHAQVLRNLLRSALISAGI